MSQIAHSSNGNCVQRAISTMRLALGYSTGLPDNWPTGHIIDYDLPALLPLAFPNRKIRVWHADTEKWSKGCDYQGTEYNYTLINDLYLTAFAYHNEDCTKSHAVVGEPVSYNGIPPINLIWSVSIRKQDS